MKFFIRSSVDIKIFHIEVFFSFILWNVNFFHQSVSDSLQSSRTTAVLEGFVNGASENVMGLLGEYYCQMNEWKDSFLISLDDI